MDTKAKRAFAPAQAHRFIEALDLEPDRECAYLLAIQGAHPKVMQELAEHYSSWISMDIFTHVNMDSKRQAVDIVSAVF